MSKKTKFVWIDDWQDIYYSRKKVKLIRSEEHDGVDLFSGSKETIIKTRYLVEEADGSREWVDEIYDSAI